MTDQTDAPITDAEPESSEYAKPFELELDKAVAELLKLRAIVDKLGVASVDGARFDAEAGWRFSMLMVQCLKHPELYPEHVGKCVAAKVAKFMREKEAARKETK